VLQRERERLKERQALGDADGAGTQGASGQ